MGNPKSINGSPELIFGRSESDEGSIFVSDTLCAYARTARVFSRYSGLQGRFRPIFDHRFLTRTLGMRTRACSLTLRSSTEVISCHEILSFVTENSRIRSLSKVLSNVEQISSK